MAIITSQITEKLHKQVFESFKPYAEQLIKEGKTEQDIVAAFQTLMRRKVNDYYYKATALRGLDSLIDDILKLGKARGDSKAEVIFYVMLTERNIPFKFQYRIGPYRADFLFNGWLVVEIDGPQHSLQEDHDKNRDSYLLNKGFTTFRIPLWILLNAPDAAIDEILALLEQEVKPKAINQ
jgi:very-short-patch-repair endonuclease